MMGLEKRREEKRRRCRLLGCWVVGEIGGRDVRIGMGWDGADIFVDGGSI